MTRIVYIYIYIYIHRIAKCPADQRWQTCASPCVETCQENQPCPDVCEARCVCKPAFPVLHDGRCMARSKCPQ